MQKEVKSSIQVIDRMMNLLDALSGHAKPVNLKHLAAQTSLHPSTAYRILAVMVARRMVDRVEPGLYRLGMRMLELGALVKSRISVRDDALPHMQRLQQQLGETVNLGVRDRDDVVCVERAGAMGTIMRVTQPVGERTPLHVTATGKVFLAGDSIAGVREYAQRTGLPRLTEKTLCEIEQLEREIEAVRQAGYALDNEEAEQGVCCIGAGILDDEGRLIAGLSVSAPAERLDPAWVEVVCAAAGDISRALGYRG